MAFTSQRRVDFAMVDLAKIIYYPEFWDLAHRFYEESWEYSCGMHYNEILSEHKIGFPLVHSDTHFLHPVSYGDTIHCTISVPRIGNTSITWRYEFHNQEGVLCWKSEQVTVCTDMREIRSKVLVPDWMRKSLSKLSPED
ncbi:MAG: acyl-CoA thioesterase [Candidatus Thalassarchaeaceae archaeon]|nr:acyl-CoA thioesterase [Candidatus Thalassarchaeaceae archaeon]MDP6703161.1 acyl-CoA thioesterase [Candidatus Thalassarchaeaceae archaeon]MDP7003806.1 acyl-CoA thioesterase [Candidatus Thalassarchaeaceae archaeon]